MDVLYSPICFPVIKCSLFIASSISSDITCNLGLFFLIFGFGVTALAALFMRLFRLRKAFSTSLAVSKVRSEDCIPSLTNSTAFYNWKTNGRIKDIHDPFLMEKKITTYELRKNCRKEMAQKRIQERQTITEADKTLFYRIIRQQRGKLTRFHQEGVMDVLYSPICFPVIKCSLFIFYSLEYFL
jgi:hypothetical protein